MTSPPKSPKAAMLMGARFGLSLTYCRNRPWRVMVLGHSGVGKSAFVVRFLTRKFIGDYDPNLERVCTANVMFDGDPLVVEILDSTGNHTEDGITIDFEEKLRWADAFVLIYSTTDKCSFDECCRLRFLVSYNKRRRRNLLGTSHVTPESSAAHVPVILVANKIDQEEDRMVSPAEGSKRCQDLSCDSFHEISVREQVEAPRKVLEQLYLHWKRLHQNSTIGRESGLSAGVKTRHSPGESSSLSALFGRNKMLATLVHRQASKSSSMDVISEREDHQTTKHILHFGSPPPDPVPIPEHFRSRASTEGSLNYRKRLDEQHTTSALSTPVLPVSLKTTRRMSFSLRGQKQI